MTTYFIGDTPVDSEESFYAAMREPLSGKKETRYVISRFDRKESEDLYLDLQESATGSSAWKFCKDIKIYKKNSR